MTIRAVPTAKARYLTDLSPTMSRALVRCHTMTIVVANGFKAYGIQTTTGNALARHSLIEHGQDKRARIVWKPTGRGVSIITADPPMLLAARSEHGYTSDLSKSMVGEPEAVDSHTQRWYTADAEDRFKSQQQGRRELALITEAQNLSRRLKQEIRSVDPTSMEVVTRLQRIRDEIQALENLRKAA